MWVVRVWEVDPPEGEERLEWFLLTNEPVETFEDAYRVVGWYECRWIVEEYHKGMKTGCKIESPQFTTEAGLKPTIALLSIVTLTLLKMRDASRRADAKTRKATEFISADYVTVLSGWRHGKERLGLVRLRFHVCVGAAGRPPKPQERSPARLANHLGRLERITSHGLRRRSHEIHGKMW